MRKIITCIGIGLLLINVSNASTKVNYNQNELQQFLQTNQCPRCDLSDAGLFGNHSQANLDNANLSCASAELMDLSQAELTNANLTSTDFTDANLSEANFAGSVLYEADFGGANLYMANISEAQLAEAASVCGAILPDGTKGKCQ